MSQTPNIHRWRAFSLLAVAAFMTVMDLTIVNTALPTIGRERTSRKRACYGSLPPTGWPTAAFCCSAAGRPIYSGAAA